MSLPRPATGAVAPPLEVPEEARLGGSETGRVVNSALLALSRTARSFTLYDAHNKAVREFLGELRTKLAKAHFWLYVPAHFVQMASLMMFYRGATALEPVLGLSSILVGVAIVLFAVVVWQQTTPAAAA